MNTKIDGATCGECYWRRGAPVDRREADCVRSGVECMRFPPDPNTGWRFCAFVDSRACGEFLPKSEVEKGEE